MKLVAIYSVYIVSQKRPNIVKKDLLWRQKRPVFHGELGKRGKVLVAY